ncbi:ATP-dependent helicase [Dictyobacter arantiisoli]|uniref:DNA 3'-5' helicase n=1 Tax=Dictyobacter arantiisoli TaxID=2014874 RepID=A0A5A5TH76_9CHLR|nr:UvrD-helicase domain-containing protein [Dictyobacter arantiisoli]GCF10423.1 DNA helicase [Dictyobacter arantiisoli]
MLEQHGLLAGLNQPQQEAVTTTEGPVLILAGPGSGKTRVITHRIAYLVQHEHISPWRIMAVTFTNKAAREMRDRMETLVGINESKEMMVGTFHAICARVLRSEADHLAPMGLSRSFVIMDTDDQQTLIKQAIKELNLDEKQYRPYAMQSMISQAKNNMQNPDQMAEQANKYVEEVAARIYKVYQKTMRKNNSVDFDDLIMLTEQLWRREPEVLKHYQRRWHYLHVDEFQDCNLPQYKLIRLLGYGTDSEHEGKGNVCVVGDDDQMIYTWRGASAENVLRFERDFPETRIILLEQNYRSTQNILDAAQGVVKRNTLRKNKKLWTEQGIGEKITVHEAYNEEQEGLYTAQEISRLLARGEIERRSDVAVMYRTNAQSRALEEQFLRMNIPYKVIGSRKFYDRKEIKDMLAYMRLLANPNDDLSLRRVINVPNRKIGPKTLGELQQWADMRSSSLYAALNTIEDHPTLGKAAKSALASFHKLITDLSGAIDELHLPELLDRIAERSGYGPELRAASENEGLDRWGNVLELRRVAEDYGEIETRTAMELFLENVALVGGADTVQSGEDGTLMSEENTDAVTLITLHAAKGLEYPVVFIVGMDEGSLPHSRSVDKPEQVEEERRLAYVGFTRAMKRLYLVRARRRSVFGETRYTEPSRFLEDIDKRLIGKKGGQSTQNTQKSYGSSTGYNMGRGNSTYARPQENWEDDFNQDPYGETGGRVFGRGSGTARTSSPSHDYTSLPSAPRNRNLQPTASSFTRPEPGKQAPRVQRFKPGERVRHSSFGDGIILKSEMEQGTEFVEVQFPGKTGKKRLSLDFARLEKI